MDFKVHVNNLVGNRNWTMWKKEVEFMLRHQEVVSYVVNGNFVCPGEPEAAATTEENNIIENKKKVTSYKNAALAQLVGSMYEGNVELTATCHIAKAISKKLIAVFEQSSIQRLD